MQQLFRKRWLILTLVWGQILIVDVNSQKIARGKSGMVVSSHPLVTEVGLTLLQAGGNAVDAAIGAALMSGVVEPYAAGLGGGGGMLIYLAKSDSLTYLNFNAQAPRLVATNFQSRQDAPTALAVLVPGTVAGLYHAWQRYGHLAWPDILRPVLEHLKAGFSVDATLSQNIQAAAEILQKNTDTQNLFFKTGFPLEAGYRYQNARLGRTLSLLAAQGARVFYEGEIADSIEAGMLKSGGGLRKTDLSAYQPIESRPVKGSYREYQLVSAPPPQAGVTLIEIFNILESLNLSELGHYRQSLKTFHFMAETFKCAAADYRQHLGDPKFHPIPTAVLVSKAFAESRFESLNLDGEAPSGPKLMPAGTTQPPILQSVSPEFIEPDASTTFTAILDQAGNAVAVTQTLNGYWGSGISVAGFLLNNGMLGFTPADAVNATGSGRQPRSTCAPVMLFKNGKLRLLVGAAGTGAQLPALAEVISNVIDFRMNPIEANLAPRFATKAGSDSVAVETRFAAALLDQVRASGHPIQILDKLATAFGRVQIIAIDPEGKRYTGAADPRAQGTADGF
ncbi:gamma-glutamyltransferase [candidate division KSB1 bacterium]|nr:gamma-glutamyltransferase [candidate division KSB1 bacterium]